MAGFKRAATAADDRRVRADARPMRLGDLLDQELDVFCWCNRCSHNGTLDRMLLLRQLGPAIAVPEIGARLRCSGCGSKDVATRPAWPGHGQITHHGVGDD